MKRKIIISNILIFSFLLFSMCGKDENSHQIDKQPLIGIWLSNVYIGIFLFGYDQGFELSEDNIYFPVVTPYPAAPIDTTFRILKEAGDNWFLNDSKDSITFATKWDSISYRIESVSNDSLVLYGKAFSAPSEENKEYLFIKKRVR